VYLHQVFDNTSDEVFSANPQQTGKAAHNTIDFKPKQISGNLLSGIYVISKLLGIYGKIDQYYCKERTLVERKYAVKTVYRGYYYQLWAQCIALEEMGFPVDKMYFHSTKDNKRIEVPKPNKDEKAELKAHIRTIAWFDFEAPLYINSTKCLHCIYASLCDKTNDDHVYA
jgi:CRISPR-associated protein Cas4